jgi:hypothetical protein
VDRGSPDRTGDGVGSGAEDRKVIQFRPEQPANAAMRSGVNAGMRIAATGGWNLKSEFAALTL